MPSAPAIAARAEGWRANEKPVGRLWRDDGLRALLRFHGPEFLARAVADWCRLNGASTVFIEPDSPWQNGVIESFGRMRD